MILGKQGDGNIKVWSKVDRVGAGLGQHGLSHLETQILGVVRPGARVEVEDQVVPAVVPRGQALDSGPDVLDILSGELVPVQRVHCQDKETGLRGVSGVKPRLFDGGQDLLVGLGDLTPGSVGGVNVNPEARLAAGEVEAGFHAAAFVLVDVVADRPAFSG